MIERNKVGGKRRREGNHVHVDPLLPSLALVALVILVIGIVSRKLGQPFVTGYLLAGILLGPDGLEVIPDTAVTERIGAIGVVFLLFYIGMEISVRHLVERWRIVVLGTLLQVAISVLLVGFVGMWLQWPLVRILLLGFVISLSSTAVVMKILEEWGELDTEHARTVLGILLVQDVALVPMLVLVGLFQSDKVDFLQVFRQVVGGILIVLVVFALTRKKEVRLPLLRSIQKDSEMQVYAALTICLGMALLTDLLGLSTALGAFVAGFIISSSRGTHWVEQSVRPFRVVFIGVFFISVGMMLDLDFLMKYWTLVILLAFLALVTNTFINAGWLRLFGLSWRECLYCGALLSQIGEFSFVLVAIGIQSHIISEFAHQMAISIIGTTLIFGPPWIVAARSILRKRS
jgi:CPA2 family monovalent cation:H+ antiporter-2